MSARLAIRIDAGGTKIEGLLVDVSNPGGPILDRRVAGTPAQDPEAVTRTIVAGPAPAAEPASKAAKG